MVQRKDEPKEKFGRAAGGAARMASLSPEQRRQLASAAAAARWHQISSASKRINGRRQQALLTRMCKELAALKEQRGILEDQILGLTKAVESFGVDAECAKAE